MTLAEIGDEVGTSYQAVQVTVRKAQHKVAAALLQRLGPAVVDLARDEPLHQTSPVVPYLRKRV